jgi:hypothetical protein
MHAKDVDRPPPRVDRNDITARANRPGRESMRRKKIPRRRVDLLTVDRHRVKKPPK